MEARYTALDGMEYELVAVATQQTRYTKGKTGVVKLTQSIHPAMAACRVMRFVSKASAAESFLSRRGSKWRAPEMQGTRFFGQYKTHGVYLLHA